MLAIPLVSQTKTFVMAVGGVSPFKAAVGKTRDVLGFIYPPCHQLSFPLVILGPLPGKGEKMTPGQLQAGGQ